MRYENKEDGLPGFPESHATLGKMTFLQVSLISLLNFSFSALTVALLTTIIHYTLRSRRKQSFPPGPSTFPVLGNAHLLPSEKAFLKFAEWAQTYGSIYGVKLGPQDAVVLNDPKHVEQLLEKRGAIYSGRASSHIGVDLLLSPHHILFMSYGEPWRKQRRALTSFLKNDARHLLPTQDAESTQMLYDVLREPGNCYEHVRRFSAGVILSSVYGRRAKTYHPLVDEIYNVQDDVSSLLAPGTAPPVDAFVFLQWLPEFIARWKKNARLIRGKHRKLYAGLFEQAKQREVADRGDVEQNCMIASLLQERASNKMSDEQIIYAGAPMIEAGSDTTASTLHSWILAILKNPEVLRKMQDELDLVCGDRMPGPADIGSLSYVRATMEETLRWRPAIPLGVPHALTQDDWYEGHFLPRDTLVFANAWAMGHDDSRFPDPDAFQPGRFLYTDRNLPYTFGAGRRICVGQRFADNSLMLAMAKLAWSFDIREDPAHPADCDVTTGYNDGLSIGPKKFYIDIRVRSERHEQLIRAAFVGANEFLKSFEQ